MHLLLYMFCLFVVSFNVIIIHSNSVSSFQPPCPDQERLALLQFKNSFHIDCSRDSPYSYDSLLTDADIILHEKTKSWVGRQSSDCCSWDGVECNRKSGHVIGLDLTASCLYGTFPPNSTIFNLAFLTKLVLSYNNFNYSRIPSYLNRLSKLRVLRLFNSKFSGQIPADISKLSELTVLDLGEDSIETQLLKLQNPSLENLIQNLTHLQELNLANVDVSSTVPVNLQNLTTLKQITIDNCNLYGKLPPNLFHLPHLEILTLGFNDDIGGSLPEFQWHSPLKAILIYDTSLSGELPHSIGRLAQLETVSLSVCQISGSIPSSLGNLTKLSYLYLTDNDIRGVVPPSISNLTNLEVLFLVNLNVEPGQLISNLGKLRKLIVVGLSGMTLRTKPSFANLTQLGTIYLTKTHGVGPLPQWLANLTQLEILELEGSQLEGPIPHWLTHLTNLQVLTLSYNNLFGNFEIFSGLKNLRYLALSGTSLKFSPTSETNSSLLNLQILSLVSCNLTEFPVFLRDHKKLEHLRLDQNLIKGSIPQWFVNTSRESLLSFELDRNNMTGFEQPVTTLPWTHLEVFDIEGNNFQGELPIPPVSIKSYDVSNNMFTGVIPKQICMARSLIMLDLSNNNLSSQLIPNCIGDQLDNSLQVLNLRQNKFHGRLSIPMSFTSNCNIRMINLSENELEGDLPRSLGNCTRLEVLDIGSNRINDTFPSWLGSLPNLQVLVLSHNNFHGSISDHNLGCPFCSLRIIDLSHNFYNGDLPSRYLRNWTNMMPEKEGQSDSYNTRIAIVRGVDEHQGGIVYFDTLKYSMTITSKGSERLYPEILEVFKFIDFSSNNFTGQIPDVIGKLKGLQALNLSNNNLDGKIPASLANMIDLESLDLSRNILYGVIPPELAQLTSLEVFDVSYNDLKGPIPQGNQFNTFLSGSYVGNSRLCGNLISKKCNNAEVQESPPMTKDESNEHSRLVDWVIRSCGCVSGFIIGIVIGKLYITDKYHEWFMVTFQQRPRRKVKRATRQQR